MIEDPDLQGQPSQVEHRLPVETGKANHIGLTLTVETFETVRPG